MSDQNRGETFLTFVAGVIVATIAVAAPIWQSLATFSEVLNSAVIGGAVVGLLLGAGLGLLLVPGDLKGTKSKTAVVVAHVAVAIIGLIALWGFNEIIDRDLDFSGRLLVIIAAVGTSSAALAYLASAVTLAAVTRIFN